MSKRKKRNAVTLVSLLFILAALIVVYVWFGKQKGNSDLAEKTKETSVSLAKTDTNKITSLHYRAKDADLTLILKGKDWVSKEDENRPINQDNVKTLLNLLGTVTATRVVNNKPENLNSYGLDNPSAYLQATMQNNSTITLQIGDKATGAEGYYARVNEDGKVYLLDDSYGTGLSYGNADFTAMEETPTIAAEKITDIAVDQRDGENFEMKYDPEKGLKDSGSSMYPWVIVKPYDAKITADSSKISQTLSNYTSFAFHNCADYAGKDLKTYGLSDPYASVYVKYYEEKASNQTGGDTSKNTDNNKKTQEKQIRVEKEYKILIGNKDESGNYYVKPEGSKAVYTMSADTVDKMLDAQAFNIVNPYIYMPAIGQVDKIDVTIDGTTYTMEIKRNTVTDKKGKKETKAAYSYNGEEVREDAFQKVYQSLITAKYDSQVKKEKGKKKDKPYMTIAYHLTGEKDVIKASFLPYDDSFYLVDTGDKIRFFADKRSIDDIASAVTSLKTKE